MPVKGVDIVIDGLEALRSKLDRFPKEAQDAAANQVNKYVLNVMREYASYKYVPFKTAYGGWFSEKQRRYVMARISEGTLHPGSPSRTQALRAGWKTMGTGMDSLIVNAVPYASFVIGDDTQSRMHKKIGWWTVGKRLKERAAEIERQAKAGVDNAIKKLKL
jgi:hypothetical protein